MIEELDDCDICGKMVYDDSFIRLEDETMESFVYHRDCWVKSQKSKPISDLKHSKICYSCGKEWEHANENNHLCTVCRYDMVKKTNSLKYLTQKQEAQIYCVKHGHAKFIWSFFDYVHCGRCGEQIGDTLAGIFSGKGYVVVGHDCEECTIGFYATTSIMEPR